MSSPRGGKLARSAGSSFYIKAEPSWAGVMKTWVHCRINWPGCIYQVYRFPLSDLSSQHSRVSKLDRWWICRTKFWKVGSYCRLYWPTREGMQNHAFWCIFVLTGVVGDTSLIGQIFYKITCYFAQELTLVNKTLVNKNCWLLETHG